MASRPVTRHRWRKRFFRLGLIFFGTLAASLLLLRSAVVSEYIAASLTRFLESRTGESFVIGSLQIEPLQGVVRIDGLVISHPGAPAGEGTIAAIKQLEARFSLRGGPRLVSVTVDRPAFRLHIDDDGLREFRALSRRGQSASPGPDRPQPPRDLPWDVFRVQDASLTVLAPNDTVLSLPEIQMTEQGGVATVSLGASTLQTPKLSQTFDSAVLSDIQVTPDHVQASDLSLRSELLELTVSGRLQPAGPVQGQIDAVVDLAELTPLMPENQSLDGYAIIEAELSGTQFAPQLKGAALVRDTVWTRPNQAFQFGEAVSIGWRLDGRTIRLEPLLARWASGLVEIRGHVEVPTRQFSVGISAEGLDLEEVIQNTGTVQEPWVDMLVDTELQLSGILQPISASGTLTLAGSALEVAGGPISSPAQERLLVIPQVWMDGELALTPGGSQITIHQAQFGRSSGAFTADLTYGQSGQSGSLDLSAMFGALDLRDIRPMAGLDLVGRGPVSLSVSGPMSSLSVDSTMDLSRFGFAGLGLADQLQGAVLSPDLRSLQLPAFQATLGDSRYDGQLVIQLGTPTPEIELQILVRAGTLPDLIGVTVDLEGIDGHVDGMMSLQGPTDRLDGEVWLHARDVSLYGERFPDGDLQAWMQDGQFTLERLELRRERDGRVESVFARGSVGKGYATNIEVFSSGLRLESLERLESVSGLHGEVSLDARLGGTLQSLEPIGRLALRQTRIQQRLVPPSTVQFRTEEGMLRFGGVIAEDVSTGTGMLVAGELDLWDDQRYTVTADMKDFPLSAFYPQAPDGSAIQALATGTLLLQGDLQDQEPRELTASVSSMTLDWAGHSLYTKSPWSYKQVDRQFSLRGLELVDRQQGTSLRFGGTGQVGGGLMLAGGGVMELDLLRMVVPSLQRAEGRARLGVAVSRLDGGEASTVVDIDVDNALVQGTWFPHPIEELSLSMSASPIGYTLERGTGSIGGGQLSFGGQIDAERWVPTRYDVSGNLQDSRVAYLDFLPAMTGDAKIAVNGPADDLLLSGTITIDEMLFSERIDWESWILEVSGERLRDAVAEETADLFEMDIRISSDNTIRMRNNVAGLTAGGELHLKGTTARPGMTGTIRAQPGGSVYLKERNFELQRAELTFLDPYSFDPAVDIAMFTDVRAREQDVEIEYLVRGLYSDWYAETRSNPPMSPADINALLLFGMTMEELERYGGLSSALFVEGGDLLASKLGIVEQIGEGIFQYELFRLDRVDLISGVSERSYSAVTSELRLLAEKDLDWGGTLRLEQNLNRASDTYISLEQKLARKLYLRGFYATEQQDRYLSIGGAYGVDMNVRWELD